MFVLEKIICNEIRFKDDEVYVIKLLKVIEINDVKEIKRALKSKSFLLMINFDNDSRVDCFKVKIKSTQKLKTKSLSLSLLLLLFKRCLKVYKISRI